MNQLDDCTQTHQHTIRNECNYTLHGYPINFVLNSGKAAQIQHGIIGEQLTQFPLRQPNLVQSNLKIFTVKQLQAGKSLLNSWIITASLYLSNSFVISTKNGWPGSKATSIHGLTKLITLYIILILTWNFSYHSLPIVVSDQCELVLHVHA